MMKVGQTVKFKKETVEQYKNIPTIMKVINELKDQKEMKVTNTETYEDDVRVQINNGFFFNENELELA